MQYRDLGRAGLQVSDIGYGAWGIGGAGGGWVGAEDDESLRALERFIELGGTFIDTARGYGRSEELVGRVLREHRDEGLIVATKVPPKNGEWPARAGVPVEEAFPGDHIRASLETSLKASGLDAFDVVQFHVWSDEWVGNGDWLETVQALKEEGKLRHFGVSINDYEPENALALIRSGAVETVQVIYNVFHQQPEEQLLAACHEHGVGVIVRVALDEGGLTGRITKDTTFEEGDFRRTFFQGDRPAQVEQHVQALADDLGIAVDEVPDVALRYVLSHPAVSTVIAGMRTVRNVERNAATSDRDALPQATVARLKAHRWERNWYRG
ncbi:aldo/keto reductase [Amnibacterium kyonggiense]|uniref:Aryl-alcohol dehydrogenase-like predicted oxidoreductase n=1 Tax=Amnibacterium kyonggiense TaxID=595671 RepID=A0A4R7FLH3_9MICO|nr:aldo/keto reductase [Amnibacterium kyonggiense]TDS77227.1 aryl-alcohol dehydrogenase-like predicted oxidoreductase [Amnibacterium kyonggiense]